MPVCGSNIHPVLLFDNQYVILIYVKKIKKGLTLTLRHSLFLLL